MAKVVFRSRALSDRCARFETMAEAWGHGRARLVQRKLQQLAAAMNLEDLSFIPGVVAEPSANRVVIELDEGMMMVVSDDSQTDANQGVNYEKFIVVEQIRISKKETR